jgi:hypothetical protein
VIETGLCLHLDRWQVRRYELAHLQKDNSGLALSPLLSGLGFGARRPPSFFASDILFKRIHTGSPGSQFRVGGGEHLGGKSILSEREKNKKKSHCSTASVEGDPEDTQSVRW